MSDKPRWYRGKVADMLRAAGYVPLPRMWVTKEQYEQVRKMALQNENHVNAVRRYCRELERQDKESDES